MEISKNQKILNREDTLNWHLMQYEMNRVDIKLHKAKSVEVGEFYLARYKVDSQLYRAIVIKQSDATNVLVCSVDYGNV